MPRRISLESDRHLQELSVFRMYLRVYLRPSSTYERCPLSIRVHEAASTAAHRILEGYEHWLSESDHRRSWGQAPWHRLSAACKDPRVHGSPGWVRTQCFHLMRFLLQHAGKGGIVDRADSQQLSRDEFFSLIIPYVDATFVADQFNRYRKSQRVFLNRPRASCRCHGRAPCMQTCRISRTPARERRTPVRRRRHGEVLQGRLPAARVFPWAPECASTGRWCGQSCVTSRARTPTGTDLWAASSWDRTTSLLSPTRAGSCLQPGAVRQRHADGTHAGPGPGQRLSGLVSSVPLWCAACGADLAVGHAIGGAARDLTQTGRDDH